jgi:hypothetical protein
MATLTVVPPLPFVNPFVADTVRARSLAWLVLLLIR